MLPDKEHTLELLIRAKYPLLYIVSSEERRIEEMLRGVAARRHKQLFSWTVTDGIADISTPKPVSVNGGARDPLQMLEAIGGSKESAIFVYRLTHF